MTVTLKAPGSKSITQRALMLAALGERPARVRGALACDDSARLTDLLRALGTGVEWDADQVLVTPGPLAAGGAPVWCGNAGTAVRFGAALSLVARGTITLDGDARMRERPLNPLGEALESLGVGVRWLRRAGFPPVALTGGGAIRGEVDVDSSLSSQFASGLLMVAPRLPAGLRIRLVGRVVSEPYLDMTARMMASAGAAADRPDGRTFVVRPGRYAWAGDAVDVEPDWSGAALLFAAGRAAGVEVALPGLPPPGESLQGDSRFAGMIEELDRPGPHAFDLSDCPDLLPPLAASALLASHPTRIGGASHTRIKESDRIAVLVRGFRALGARIVEHTDGMEILPLADRIPRKVALDPAGDHRMAMAFAAVSLAIPGVSVQDPGCVAKSFPAFWDAIDAIRAAADGPG